MSSKQIPFEKFHGNGNDFIFFEKTFENSFATEEQLKDFVRHTCHRNFGIGADGVLFVDDSQKIISIFNSDGSTAATCGNALRCYGLRLLKNKLWDGKTPLEIKDTQKNKIATLWEGSSKTKKIEVAMGQESRVEIFPVEENPFFAPSSLLCVFVQLANSHLVFLHEKFSQFNQEHYQAFGQWAQKALGNHNINMIHCPSFDKQKNSSLSTGSLTVYERGAGLTLCCGSGAVASRVALEKLGFVNPNQSHFCFQLAGGELDISFRNIDEKKIWTLKGPAQKVYEGSIPWH